MIRAAFASSADHPATAAGATTVSLEPAFDFTGDDYRTLFEGSGATAFQSPEWLAVFYRRLAPHRGARPIIVVGRDANGGLRFVLPLILRRKSGVMLLESTDLGVSDYAAPVIAAGYHPDRHDREAIAAALPACDIIRIRPVRHEHAAGWRSLLELSETPLDFSAHATDVAMGYEAWRAAALDASFARYLNRKKKRFFKGQGAALRLLEDPSEIAAAIATIQTDRKGRFEGDPIQQDPVRDFYAEIAMSGPRHGIARTYALMLEGEAIGHVFGLTHAGRYHYLLIGCDYDRHGRHSPGLIMYDAMIADWAASGGTVFDFTIGDEAFKKDFGTEPTAMVELVQLPTWRGRLARAAFDARERLQRLRAARKAKA